MSNLTPIRVTGTVTTTPSGTQDVRITAQTITLAISAASLPLPTNAAKETGGNLDSIKADLDKFQFDGSGNLKVNVELETPEAVQIKDSVGTIINPAKEDGNLLSIKTDLDKNTYASNRLLVDGSGVVQPVSGTVAVSNFPVSQSVTQGTSPWIVDGSGFTQPVSGSFLTDAQLRATPVPVSGTISTSPNVNVHDGAGNTIDSTGTSLNVDVTNTVPVTGTFFQATQPVSGTVTVTQATGTNLHAVIDNFPATQNVAVISSVLPTGAATEATLAEIEEDLDQFTFTATRLLVDGSGVVQPVSGTITANQGTSPWVISGIVTANAGTGNFTVIQPTGTNLHVVLDSGTLTSITNALPAGTNVIGHVITDTGSTTAVTGTVAVTQSTSPWIISGAVTNTPPANQSVNLTQENGINLGSPSAYGTSPGAVNVLGVNAFITNTPAVTLASTTITGNVTVTQATGTNLHTVVDNFPADADALAQGSSTSGQLGALIMGATTTAAPSYTTATTNPLSLTTTGALRVDGSAITQPISGTVTANAGTGIFAVGIDQTGDNNDVDVVNGAGAAAVNIQDGGNSLTVDNNGTFLVQAAQSGTWTVQPGNTANTTPWLIEPRSATIATYSAAITGLVAAATPTDIFTITGSGTKTIKILRIVISAIATTETVYNAILLKRSTANSGGTSSTLTNVSHDTNNAAGTATVLAYTANPSLGALVGNIASIKLIAPLSLPQQPGFIAYIYDFHEQGQPIVLRGTSQVFAVNLNSTTITGNNFDISIDWTEE